MEQEAGKFDMSTLLVDFEFGERLNKKFERYGIRTLDDLERIGVSGLAELGVTGSAFLGLMEKLERGGVNVTFLFDKKRRNDRKMMGMLSTPLSKVFDHPFVLETFFSRGFTRVKHIVGMPRAVMADMFFKRSVDGFAVADSVLGALEEFGVRRAENGALKFDEAKLEGCQEPSAMDVPVMELGLGASEKAILLKNKFYTAGDVLERSGELMDVRGVGTLTHKKIMRVVSECVGLVGEETESATCN